MNRDKPRCRCKAVFNRLSRADRLKLKSAATFKALSGFMRDETAAKPVRYPFYATYLLVVATPFPIPLASTVTVAATLIWAHYSKSAAAQRLKGQVKKAFNDQAALVRDHKDYIAPASGQADKYSVKGLSLAWHTTRHNFRDIGKATAHAYQALKDYICK